MERKLTGDVELARGTLVELVERRLLRLGELFNLPGDLRPLPARNPRALTIEHAAAVPMARPSRGLVRMERVKVTEAARSPQWWWWERS